MLPRKARSPTGAKMFEPSEYLRKEQIVSFFSRLSAQKSKGNPFQSEDEFGDKGQVDDYQNEFEQERALRDMIDAISMIDSSLAAEQSSTPSSMNESKEEEEAIPATREKEDIPKLSLKVKKVYGDGQCLFRSVAVAHGDASLSCVRNEGGWPTGVDLAKQETEKAD